MKVVSLFLFSFCLALSSAAQKVFFIYLETDNKLPFYIKMGDRTQSSSSPGYIILSNLVDSTYTITIGFSSRPDESRFAVPLQGRDRGFKIRNNEIGLELVDFHTGAVIAAQPDDRKSISYERRDDAFTTLLSKAANDPGLMLVPVVLKQDATVKKDEPKTEEKKPAVESVKKDTGTAVSTVTETIAAANQAGSEDKKGTATGMPDSAAMAKTVTPDQAPHDTIAALPVTEAYKRSVVKKHSESSTSEGFGLVFYDSYEGGKDTVQLIIPNPKIVFRQPDTALPEDTTQMLDPKKVMESQEKTVTGRVEPSPKAACKAVAREGDFLKLRKNMANKMTDEGMVDEAKKYFRTKCFSTEQIKNLSTLFLTSAGKFQFFDAAYLHVTDREQFPALASEIKDDYYSKRFKTLTGQ
ncbi:MAG TPA: DUF4476 domain-containing protein [Flavisolibacter sp.]|nr:DUF4476 domain-containing protein [Flavisolibacter sp.]